MGKGKSATDIEKGQIQNIAKILKCFLSKKGGLEGWYDVKVPELPACLKKENIFNDNDSNFTKNIKLKQYLWKQLTKASDAKKKVIVKWIVDDWGGITLKDGALVLNTILNDIKESAKNDFDIRLSDRISSRSKVLSFLNPKKYAICDSRVIFSLNWFLFLTRNGNLCCAFQKLESRNKILKAYSLSSLLEKHSELGKAQTYHLYSEFCDFMKKLTNEINKSNSDWKLYNTEMLLFAIANDIKDGIPFLIRELFINAASLENITAENALNIFKLKK